jgi:multiple sugar transport system ATP-binding protein
MNFLRASVTRENGHARVTLGEQTLVGPAALAEAAATDGAGLPDADVLMGIRAENIEARAEPPVDGTGLAGEVLVVEPLGSHLLITVSVDGQRLKVLTRTDFETGPGRPIWLQPESDKIRWHRGSDGTALAV